MGYTLTNIVNELIIEKGEAQGNRFARYYQLGVACLREQNMDLSGIPKIVSLEVSPNDTVDLPADYMNYTRIALCGMDGQLHSLGRNENLCLNKVYNACGVPSNENNTSTIGASSSMTDGLSSIGGQPWLIIDYPNDNYRNGELMGRFFGIGGGNNQNGYYRFDIPNGQILLGGLPIAIHSIVLEYIADITSNDGDFDVHPFLVETVKDYIFWKSISRDRNRNANEKQMAMIDYQKSERLSRIRFNSRTNEEWLMAFRAGNQAAVKW